MRIVRNLKPIHSVLAETRRLLSAGVILKYRVISGKIG